jgi:hypothetical protein
VATHDYNIANNTGANVRSDINGALAAIVSNNSSSTEPATTFAFQWWADTNNTLLKIRNAANSAWVTVGDYSTANLGLVTTATANSTYLALAGGTVTGALNIGTAGSLVFEGATADDFETTLAVTDPTADRTITLPNATGTVPLLSLAQTFTAAQRGSISAISVASGDTTKTLDFATANNFALTLANTASCTLANPSNLTAGQSGSIFVVQDATGGRLLTYGSSWDFAGGTAPTLSTAASAVDRIDYVVRTTSSIHAVFTAAYS